MKALMLLILTLVTMVDDIPRSWEKACLKAVRKSYPSSEIEMRRRITEAVDHDRPSPGIVVYDLLDRGEIAGYAVMTSAKGKHDYFDYLVIYDTGLSIRHVQVFEYRSDHGFEICSRGWLSQFEGKSGCSLNYGTDIDAVSGATYSAPSLTEDISYLCYFLQLELQ